MDVRPRDILIMKKKHPCGSSEWEILRVGADFRVGCSREFMIPRNKIEKNIKRIVRNDNE